MSIDNHQANNDKSPKPTVFNRINLYLEIAINAWVVRPSESESMSEYTCMCVRHCVNVSYNWVSNSVSFIYVLPISSSEVLLHIYPS